ncbi:MAG TPA: hypothetical protein VG329_09985 [Candidatus Dormibacteraeota bacterium]|jgi:hypothetical protein|nr:hypothetical protein [Candidatus Dormibacteraeota bacterium]
MSQSRTTEWQRVELYSEELRITGEMEIEPPLRLSDEANRLQDWVSLRNTLTEPMLSSYPVVSSEEANSSVARASIVMILPEGGPPQHNPMMWKEKIRHQIVLNTTAFSMAADVHLEPNEDLRLHFERYPRDFLPITRVSAIMVASLSGMPPGTPPRTLQREFALVNPAAIVSFSQH